MAVPITQPTAVKDWEHHSYQALEPGVKDGNYVSSDSVLIAAGPPRLDMFGGSTANAIDPTLMSSSVYVVGLGQGVSVSQSLQQMRIYEIGSNFDYIMTGRSIGQLTITKMFFSASSLARVLYAWYSTSAVKTIEPLVGTVAGAANIYNDVYISPGTNNLFMNLQSDLFKNPLGLMIIMRTSQNDDIGAFYLERAVMHSLSIGFDPQGIIIQENTTLSFSRIVTIDLANSNLLGALSHYANLFNL